jgi:hypothetical protein
MKPVSKEEFLAILERQQKSGLSIKDFCANESYTVSSFHYWKTKFGLTRPYNNHAPDAPTDMLAPINLNLPIKALYPRRPHHHAAVRERSGSNYREVSRSVSLAVPRQRSLSIY